MAHLAARPRGGLAIDVQAFARLRQLGLAALDVGSDEVFHHCVRMAGWVAERPSGDGADMLLELRTGAGIDRPVPGIVDPRGELVNHKLFGPRLANHKEFDPDDAHVVECAQHPGGDVVRRLDGADADLGRNRGLVEDASLVDVFTDVVNHNRAVTRTRELLEAGRAVLVVDSGGVERTAALCNLVLATGTKT